MSDKPVFDTRVCNALSSIVDSAFRNQVVRERNDMIIYDEFDREPTSLLVG
jgi:hypothetical protein